MAEDQRNARIFGVLFLITYITSIPALLLYQPVLDDPAGFIAGDADVNQIYLGALLELLLIIATSEQPWWYCRSSGDRTKSLPSATSLHASSSASSSPREFSSSSGSCRCRKAIRVPHRWRFRSLH